MPSTVTSPCTDHCATVPWQQVIAEATSPDCFAYCGAYCKKAAQAEEAGDDVARNVYAFFARVTCLAFRLDDPTAPLGDLDRLDSIADAELPMLAAMVTETGDPELRARIADILWLKNYGESGKRDYRYGQIAVTAYLESARRMESPEHWTLCFERVERSLQVASSLGKGGKNRHYLDVIAYVEEMLDHYQGDDPLYLSAQLMELLQCERRGDPAKYAPLAEKAARRAEVEHDWYRAREYWQRKARWHELAGDAEQRKHALVAAAETYISNAQQRISGEQPDFLTASAFYREAIEAFRQIGGMQARCDQLHQTLLTYQEKGVSQMGHFSASEEIPNAADMVEQARAHVRGKSVPEALMSLAYVSTSPRIQTLRASVEEVHRHFPLSTLFSRVLVNERGRTQKQVPPSPGEIDATPFALETAMFEYAINSRSEIVLAQVLPSLQQINLEHNVRIRDFAPLVGNSPFVPVGREGIFARGLHAGLMSDFLVATHLLIPQFENAVRLLLESRGVLVSGLDDDGAQPERGLNTTLERPQAQELFGEDLTFDLRGLLVEKAGSNMRHAVVHGLLDEHRFQRTEAVYVWWITLRICVLAAAAMPAERGPEPSE